MESVSQSVISDGKLLRAKFDDADGIISAGELDYTEFSSELVRKIVYLQKEFSSSASAARYESEKVDGFRGVARHFLTDLKDGALTQESTLEVSRHLKNNFPKLQLPKK